MCLIRRQDRTRTEAIPLSWSVNCFPSMVNLNACGLARRFYVGKEIRRSKRSCNEHWKVGTADAGGSTAACRM